MSVYPATFGFSEHSLTNRQGFNCIVAATFAAIAFIVMFSASHFQVQYLGLFALVCVIVFVSIWLIFVLQTRYIVKRWRQMSLHVGPDGLVRDSGTVRQAVSWDSITNVRFHHDPRGEPRTIEVFTCQWSTTYALRFRVYVRGSCFDKGAFALDSEAGCHPAEVGSQEHSGNCLHYGTGRIRFRSLPQNRR